MRGEGEIQIDEGLLAKARAVASRENIPVSALLEEGLRHALAHRDPASRPPRNRRAQALADQLRELAECGWDV